jgi:hypothetical protein
MPLKWEKRGRQWFSDDGQWRIGGKWGEYRLQRRWPDGRPGWVSSSTPGARVTPPRFDTLAEAQKYAETADEAAAPADRIDSPVED